MKRVRQVTESLQVSRFLQLPLAVLKVSLRGRVDSDHHRFLQLPLAALKVSLRGRVLSDHHRFLQLPWQH